MGMLYCMHVVGAWYECVSYFVDLIFVVVVVVRLHFILPHFFLFRVFRVCFYAHCAYLFARFFLSQATSTEVRSLLYCVVLCVCVAFSSLFAKKV